MNDPGDNSLRGSRENFGQMDISDGYEKSLAFDRGLHRTDQCEPLLLKNGSGLVRGHEKMEKGELSHSQG